MRVRVYRNLRHGRKAPPLYSIQHKGKVIARRHKVLLCDVHFVVNESGRQRVLRSKQKCVHAYCVGILVDTKGAFGIDASGPDLPAKVIYDPYKGPSFTWEGHRVSGARAVLLNAHGMTACYLE